MKKCIKCEVEKELVEFHKNHKNKDGHINKCKSCVKEYQKLNRDKKKEYDMKYYESNKDKIAKQGEEYRQNNRDKIIDSSRKYYECNKDKIAKQGKEYRKNNKERINEYQKNYYEINKELKNEYYENNKERINKNTQKYYKNNKNTIQQKNNEYNRIKYEKEPLYKLKINIKSCIRNSIVRKGYKKTSRTHEILGCNFDELLEHLNDNNYNFKFEDNLYDIDHIIPLSSTTTEEEIYRLNHYTNLQLLPSYYNRYIKRNNEFNEEKFKEWLYINNI